MAHKEADSIVKILDHMTETLKVLKGICLGQSNSHSDGDTNFRQQLQETMSGENTEV